MKTVAESRANVVSSFTIIKGSLIAETWEAFRCWDLSVSKQENLQRIKSDKLIRAKSANWLRDVAFVLGRRFDPDGRDRPLVELAKAGCRREVWDPLLLWHLTRDEFLVRDFFISWLYGQFADGVFRLHPADVAPYLRSLSKKRGIEWSGKWSEATTERVATGLLRMAADFGLMSGGSSKEFASYHLPEESFLYLLHAMTDAGLHAKRLVEAPDWKMFLMDASDVERELLRLHQFRKVHYEVAGTIVQLDLPFPSAAAYAKEISG
ncbi:MAG: BrxA family protein [Dehalococcoidia bacterium]